MNFFIIFFVFINIISGNIFMNDNSKEIFNWNSEILEFVNKLKSKYEKLILQSQFDVQRKVIDLIEKIGNDIIDEIDSHYNSDMRVFTMINDCFKKQSKIYHAFADFLHDYGKKNGINSLFY